ncbi:MAG: hypothetical protein MZV70_73775 [Desulfobacterales bacterium]|nr:hypothetical protein [Desulfobacterales bacterium]
MEKKENISFQYLFTTNRTCWPELPERWAAKAITSKASALIQPLQYEISKIVMTTIGNQATITRIENQLQQACRCNSG